MVTEYPDGLHAVNVTSAGTEGFGEHGERLGEANIGEKSSDDRHLGRTHEFHSNANEVAGFGHVGDDGPVGPRAFHDHRCSDVRLGGDGRGTSRITRDVNEVQAVDENHEDLNRTQEHDDENGDREGEFDRGLTVIDS